MNTNAFLMGQCSCMLVIGEHFSEPGLVKIIHDYTLEHRWIDVHNVINRSKHSAIQFGCGRAIEIYYSMYRNAIVLSASGTPRKFDCEPGDVPDVLDKFDEHTLLDIGVEYSPNHSVQHCLREMRMLADEIRNTVKPRCIC